MLEAQLNVVSNKLNISLDELEIGDERLKTLVEKKTQELHISVNTLI